MSTRAGIIIKDKSSQSHYYKHSDGYPEGVLPTLELFIKWVKDGHIRNNVGQAAGWLVILGAIAYNTIPKYKLLKPSYEGGKWYGDEESIEPPADWKCGAYEPTDNVKNHGDLEYIYTVDLVKLTITHKEV